MQTDRTILSEFFDVAALAAELGREGKPLSHRTIARYENEPDGLPSVMIGGRKYFRRLAVVEWLKKREHRPNPRRSAQPSRYSRAISPQRPRR